MYFNNLKCHLRFQHIFFCFALKASFRSCSCFDTGYIFFFFSFPALISLLDVHFLFLFTVCLAFWFSPAGYTRSWWIYDHFPIWVSCRFQSWLQLCRINKFCYSQMDWLRKNGQAGELMICLRQTFVIVLCCMKPAL